MADQQDSDFDSSSARTGGGGGGDASGGRSTQRQPTNRQQGGKLFAQSIQDTLQRNGELGRLQAAMRATILNVVRGGVTTAMNRVADRPAAVELVNELIVDYLRWSGHSYALDMFVTESGTEVDERLTQPDAAVAMREDLAHRVAGGRADGGAQLAANVHNVPVLLAMVVQGMRMDDESEV